MDAFLGMISAFGFSFTPTNWMACNGQMVSVQSNSALFALLGTQFGGNGQSTFGIPDLRGRTLVGMGNGPGLSPVTIGQMAGTQQATIGAANMPAHNHGLSAASLSVYAAQGDSQSPQNNFLANSAMGNSYSENGGQNSAKCIAGATDPAGGSQPISIMNPYLGINYCICVAGIFPSRN
jgi:microcystin-dependent protein